jgi:hypothetical protein
MDLRKTVAGNQGVFRVFEVAPNVFHVLDAEGRTVDKFEIVETRDGANGVSAKHAFRRTRLPHGVPDLSAGFTAELANTKR